MLSLWQTQCRQSERTFTGYLQIGRLHTTWDGTLCWDIMSHYILCHHMSRYIALFLGHYRKHIIMPHHAKIESLANSHVYNGTITQTGKTFNTQTWSSFNQNCFCLYYFIECYELYTRRQSVRNDLISQWS